MLTTQLPLRGCVDRRGRIGVLCPAADLLTCAVLQKGAFATAEVQGPTISGYDGPKVVRTLPPLDPDDIRPAPDVLSKNEIRRSIKTFQGIKRSGPMAVITYGKSGAELDKAADFAAVLWDLASCVAPGGSSPGAHGPRASLEAASRLKPPPKQPVQKALPKKPRSVIRPGGQRP